MLFYRSFVLSSPSCNGTVYGQEAIDAFGGGAGLYVAYDSEAKESDPAPYTMVTNDKNQLVPTFCATGGVIAMERLNKHRYQSGRAARMIYHDLTSRGGGMPMRTGIPLSAKGFRGRKDQPGCKRGSGISFSAFTRNESSSKGRILF